MYATGVYDGNQWEVICRLHDVMRGDPSQPNPKRPNGGRIRNEPDRKYYTPPLVDDVGPGMVDELVLVRSTVTGLITTMLPSSLGLESTPKPPYWAEDIEAMHGRKVSGDRYHDRN